MNPIEYSFWNTGHLDNKPGVYEHKENILESFQVFEIVQLEIYKDGHFKRGGFREHTTLAEHQLLKRFKSLQTFIALIVRAQLRQILVSSGPLNNFSPQEV